MKGRWDENQLECLKLCITPENVNDTIRNTQRTALETCALNGRFLCVQWLCEVMNADLGNAIDDAAFGKDANCIAYLISRGANVNGKALSNASYFAMNIEMTQLLIDAGANTAQNCIGQVIQEAVFEPRAEKTQKAKRVVNALMHANARIDYPDCIFLDQLWKKQRVEQSMPAWAEEMQTETDIELKEACRRSAIAFMIVCRELKMGSSFIRNIVATYILSKWRIWKK